MKVLFRYAALLAMGAGIATQASAFESLLGDYDGKIKLVQDYGGEVGDSCKVTVGSSDLYGGAISFEIQGAEKLVVEKRRVEADFKPGVADTKWVTPGGSAKPGEMVMLKLRGDGSLLSVKLHLRWGAQHREKAIVCGELARRTR